MESDLIVVVAGGTGGHILPGICIGEALERAGNGAVEVEYISGRRPVERLVYGGNGLAPVELRSSLNPRRLALLVKSGLVTADFLEVVARFVARRPRAVVAMGGAVCFPVLSACVVLRIPFFLHESNAVPGRVVTMFSALARRVFMGLGSLPGRHVVRTGTPVRSRSRVAPRRNVVLCVGGSQGAARLNAMFVEAVAALDAPDLHFLLVSGPGQTVENPGRVEVREYVADMPGLLREVCFAVSRAGAGSLADLAAFRVPSILVPYPHAMDNHQEANARVYTDAGAAVLRLERDLDGPRLGELLGGLLADGVRLRAMAAALEDLDTPDAADRIAHEILLTTGRRAALPSFVTAKGIPS